MNNQLLLLDKATKLLAEAKDIVEVKHIIDIAEMAEVYAKKVKLGTEAEEYARSIKLEAQRKAGEFLQTMPKNEGNRYGGNLVEPPYNVVTPTLEEIGITKKQSMNWQQLAKLPTNKFEEVKNGDITIKEAKKELRKEEIKEQRIKIAEQGKLVPNNKRIIIECADINKWNTNQKFDYIITDPPYPKEFITLYEVLAKRSIEWLKDGGLLITMCGQSYLDDIISLMNNHLDYYWTGCYLTEGQPTPLRQVNVNTTWKPLLMFIKKGDKYTGKIFGDVFRSTANDKDFHKWGQSVSGMNDIISTICLEGQSILDPFCGAGTTGVAAINNGCLFTGIDISEENVNISKKRLYDIAEKK